MFTALPLLSRLLCAAAFIFAAASSQALTSRTFVSGRGADSPGCGAVASPCRTFQVAHDNTSPGGAISVLDSGEYGPVHIQKSISIVNDGAGTASILGPGGGADIIIDNVGANDKVLLRGLSLAGPAGSGVDAVNVGALIVTRCVFRGFSQRAIRLHGNGGPTSFLISDTIAEKSGIGVEVISAGVGSAKGVIERLGAFGNSTAGVMASPSAGGAINVSVVESVLANNSIGLWANGATVAVSARNVVASHNGGGFGGEGFRAENGAILRIAHSAATGNSVAVEKFGGAIVESYGDNDLRGNGSAVAAGTLTTVANQ